MKSTFKRIGLMVAAVLLAGSAATAQQGGPRAMVLQGGTLIDGTGKPPVLDAVVVVQGNRITAVGRRGQVTIPANANVINLAGRTILPGLIDGHVHTQDWHFPMFMHYGITSFADLDNDTAWIFAEKALLNSGKMKGPRMFVAGGKLYGPLNYGYGETDPQAVVNRNVDDVKEHMRVTEGLGADYLKIDDTLTYEQLAAITAEGKAKGLKVIGHTQNIRLAARMGVEFMEHMDTMARAILDPDGKKFAAQSGVLWYPPRGGAVGLPQVASETLVNPSQFPPLIAELVKEGIFVNPTLEGSWMANSPRYKEFTADAMALAKDPGLGFVPAGQKALWSSSNRERGKPRAGWSNVVAFLKAYSAAGGKIIVGTDASRSQAGIPGLSEHYEMQLLVDVGVPPMKVLQGATLWNAQMLGQDKNLGSVEVGKLADFTIIEGDPLANIANTRNVRMVIKDGQVVDVGYDPKWTNPIPHPFNMFPQLTLRTTDPLMAPQNSPAVTLRLEGAGFAPDAVAHFDNVNLPTKYVSSTELTATHPPDLLRKVGEYSIYVVNPHAGGSVSPGRAFLVNFKQ